MDYSFNVEAAVLYGVNEAIFLHNLYYWIFKNEANGRHYIDGKTWTYNSTEALTNLFPFWSKDQINRLIAKLQGNGLIEVGHFNKRGWDRTRWFAIAEEVLDLYERSTISRNRKIHLADSQNPFSEIATTIPDNKPDNKPDVCMRFTPPNTQQVSDYCKEKGYQVDAKRFISFYESKGWMVGSSPMRNWRAAVDIWQSNLQAEAAAEKSLGRAGNQTPIGKSISPDEDVLANYAYSKEGGETDE